MLWPKTATKYPIRNNAIATPRALRKERPREGDRTPAFLHATTCGASFSAMAFFFEGTSDPYGRVWTANLLRKQEDGALQYEAITFSTNFRQGFEPSIFQPVLPKNLIHQMESGGPIQDFFAAWKAAATATIGYKQFGLRQWFIESTAHLSELGYNLDLRKKMLRSGFLTWKYPSLDF